MLALFGLLSVCVTSYESCSLYLYVLGAIEDAGNTASDGKSDGNLTAVISPKAEHCYPHALQPLTGLTQIV